MAVASLVLGIIALVVSVFVPAFGWLAAIIGIIGIILGALGRKKAEKKGVATAGLVMSIIAVALGLVLYIACAACVSAATAELAALGAL